MNKRYRLVFNRALGTLQVASELATSRGAGNGASGASSRGTRAPLAVAAAIALSLAGTSAFAQTTIAGVDGSAGQAGHGGAGSEGINFGGDPSSGVGIPGNAGGSFDDLGGGQGAINGPTGSLGGTSQGGGAGASSNGYAGGGGAGGGLSSAGQGSGGGGASSDNVGQSAGGGGGGGVGHAFTSAMTNTSDVVGGKGGDGLYAADYTRSGAGGGGAGAWVSLSSTLTNEGNITGGQGGGGDGVAGGGGAGAIILAGSALINNGGITGGASGQSTYGTNGSGGDGVVLADGASLSNGTQGVITGGSVTVNNIWGGGSAGVGIHALGNDTLSIAGSVSGGKNTDGSYADAILLEGTGNTLELQSGYAFQGNVVSTSAATLSLGGAASGTFNLGSIAIVDPGSAQANSSQFVGFTQFQKDGAGQWTLTGNSPTATQWEVKSGTLALAGNAMIASATVDAGGDLWVQQSAQVMGNTGAAGADNPSGTAGAGGAGSTAVTVTGGSVENAQQIYGGMGGHGGNANGDAANNPNGGVGGNGGAGGDGITGTDFTVTNTGVIHGGAGGDGGDANNDVDGYGSKAGNAGAGGNGVSGSGFSLLNLSGGNITGGSPGMWGNASAGAGFLGTNGGMASGGYGVLSTGNSVVYNNSSISGGANIGGGYQNAIEFEGGNNVLTVGSGGSFRGNVVSLGGDTLQFESDANEFMNVDLGTIVTAAPDASQTYYVGFDHYAKLGDGILNLSGHSDVATNWVVTGGTLMLTSSANGTTSIASANMIDGTTLSLGGATAVQAGAGTAGASIPNIGPTPMMIAGTGSNGVTAVWGNQFTLNNGGTIAGGMGGSGGSAAGAVQGIAPMGTTGLAGFTGGIGGVGGTGGTAVSGNGIVINNDGDISGGAGGQGGSAAGGQGGQGGEGMTFIAFPMPGGTGGNGGQGGNGGIGGQGGNGGTAIEGAQLTITNAGHIIGGEGGMGGSAPGGAGGAGGAAGIGGMAGELPGVAGTSGTAGANGVAGIGGAGGVGIRVHGDSTILNSGSIAGGLSFAGNAHAEAIILDGGNNKVELTSTGVLVGNVVSNSGTTQGGDTFALVGDTDGTFDMSRVVSAIQPPTSPDESQIYGFQQFDKDGASTWTLTGQAGTDTRWFVSQGTLAFTGGEAIGGAGAMVALLGGTSFENTQATTYTGGLILVGGSDTLQTDADLTLTGLVTGDAGLIKTGSGTLTLAGNATYSGGTTVAAGTLQIGNGGQVGSVLGDIVDNSAVAFDRQDAVLFGNVISGTGSVEQKGTGSLVLTGANTYTGGTTISAGSLWVGNGGTTGSIVGDVVDNADLAFNRSDSVTFAGTISGTGTVEQLGTGRLTLTGNNTYTGVTTVLSGSLQIGNGGTTGAIVGNVNNSALLLFNRSDDVTYAGAIAGQGAVTQKGTGSLTLTGNNTYTGGTFVTGGTLNVGNGGTSGAIAGDLDVETAVNFARADDVVYGGTITGAGSLAQRGQGRLTLTGDATYTGGTLVKGGTLQLGNGGTTGSIVGNVDDEGTLAFNHSNDVQFDGVISGNGAVVQNGSGTLTLTAANTYAGGTIVNSGTLVGNATSLQGNIVDYGSLVFDQASDGVFAGELNGNGLFTKAGAGQLILNGKGNFNGTTTITGGTLEVGDADHADATLGGDVDVQAAGVLRGHGTINGDVTNAGTLRPGGSVGTLTINGNYTQTAAGLLLVDTLADGTGSTLKVNGNANIAGAAMLVLPSSDWVPNTEYQVLNASGGVTGQFASVQSNFAFVNPTLTYGTSNVGFSLTRNQVAFPDVAVTPNAKAASAVVEKLGSGNAVYDAVLMLDAPTAVSAFNQLEGQIHASTRTAIMDNDRYVRDAITSHLAGVGSAATGSDATSDGGVTAWTSAWGHWGSHDGNGNAFDLSHNGSGLVVGADMAVGGDYRIGAIVGSGQGTARTDLPGDSSHQNGQWAGLYGAAALGAVNLQAGAVYGWQKIDTSRMLSFGNFAGSADARYHATTAQGYVDGSYAFAFGKSTVSPFANVAYDYLHTDAMHETGSAAALTAAAQGSSVGTSTVGVRGSFALDDHGALRANMSLGWQHAWGDVTPVTALRFASGSDTFDITGVPAARNAAAVNAGVSFQVAKNVSVDATYSGQFGSHATDQSARMSVNWAF